MVSFLSHIYLSHMYQFMNSVIFVFFSFFFAFMLHEYELFFSLSLFFFPPWKQSLAEHCHFTRHTFLTVFLSVGVIAASTLI